MQLDDLEDFRPYLNVLARQQLDGRYRRKIDPADVVQETLLQAIRMHDQYRGSTSGELLGWLRTILSRKLLDVFDFYQRDKRNLERERSMHDAVEASSNCLVNILCDSDSSPSKKVSLNEQLLLVAKRLERLPEEQRAAVELHYLGGSSFSEVAEIMEKTKPQVAGLIRRGIAALGEDEQQ